MRDTHLCDGAAELIFYLLIALAHQVWAGRNLARSQLVLQAMWQLSARYGAAAKDSAQQVQPACALSGQHSQPEHHSRRKTQHELPRHRCSQAASTRTVVLTHKSHSNHTAACYVTTKPDMSTCSSHKCHMQG